MTFLEEVKGKVAVVIDYPIAKAFAEIRRHFGHHIKCSVGLGEADAWYFAHKVDDKVAAALKCLTHLFHAILRTGKGGFGSLLGYR